MLDAYHRWRRLYQRQVVTEMADIEREVKRIEDGEAWDEADEVVDLEVKKPLDKVIPVRLPSEKWEALRQEAREVGVGPTTLARIWLLERLRDQKAGGSKKRLTG